MSEAEARAAEDRKVAPTPTPWVTAMDGSHWTLIRAGDKWTGRRVASTWVSTRTHEIRTHEGYLASIAQNMANAELIVRAVNAHDELVAALREASDVFQLLIDPGKFPGVKSSNVWQLCLAADRHIHAALSKAGGTDA